MTTAAAAPEKPIEEKKPKTDKEAVRRPPLRTWPGEAIGMWGEEFSYWADSSFCLAGHTLNVLSAGTFRHLFFNDEYDDSGRIKRGWRTHHSHLNLASRVEQIEGKLTDFGSELKAANEKLSKIDGLEDKITKALDERFTKFENIVAGLQGTKPYPTVTAPQATTAPVQETTNPNQKQTQIDQRELVEVLTNEVAATAPGIDSVQLKAKIKSVLDQAQPGEGGLSSASAIPSPMAIDIASIKLMGNYLADANERSMKPLFMSLETGLDEISEQLKTMSNRLHDLEKSGKKDKDPKKSPKEEESAV